MRSGNRVWGLWLGALAFSAFMPRCNCEDGPPPVIEVPVEMKLTFLEEDSCSNIKVQRRIPDDYQDTQLVASTDFGSKGDRTFEIRSVGTANLRILEVSLSKESPEFSISLEDAAGMPVTLPLSIPPNGLETAPPGMVIKVSYASMDDQPDLIDLVVKSDDKNREEVRFALSAGRGKLQVCTGDKCDGDAAVQFGNVSQGTEETQTLVIKNVGEGDLDLRSIRLESMSAEFCAPEATEVPEGSNCNLIRQCMVLKPGESYTVNVKYRPDDGNEDTGQIVIVSGDAGAGNVSVPINGRGAGPAVCACVVEGTDCLPAPAISFGAVDVGASVSKTIRLVSCGTDPVNISEAVLEMDQNSPFRTGPEFSITTPFSVGSIDPTQAAEGVITYSPMAGGRHSGGLRYTTGHNMLSSWIALSGQASTCDLEPFPGRLDFGTVAGGSNADRVVALTNNGAKDCTVSAITMPSSEFTFPNPPNLPLTVAPGQDFPLTVRFSPPAGPVQGFMSSFDVTSDEPGAGATSTVELVAQGGGTPVCDIQVSPSGGSIGNMRDGLLNFGAVNVGYTTTLPIRIQNVGNSVCTLSNATLNSLRGRNEFMVTPPSLPAMISPGTTATIDVAFSPMAASMLPYTSFANSVDFTVNGPGLMQNDWSIGILARATEPTIDVLPRDVDFGVVTWERPQAPDNRSSCGSQTRTVSVYNSGNGTLTITGVSIASSSDPVFLVTGVTQNGSTVPAPYNNIQIPGGGNIEVQLRFYPSRATPANHMGLLVIDNDVTNPMGNGAPLTVPLAGEATTNSNQIDRFEQLRDNKVDILWVVDDSGSMSEEQTQLANNFNAFISFADTLGVDYQVGVITTEVNDASTSGIMWACNGFNTIIRNTDANRVMAFQCAANVTNPPNGNRRPNPGGSDSQEAGLQAARIALDVPNVNMANAGFLRADARLAVMVVSDEDDQSDGSVNLYIDFFRTLKGYANPQLISVSAIAGDSPGGCATAAAGDRYLAAVQGLNGQFGSICSNSWSQLLSNIGLGVFALRSSWTLSRPADANTIQVTVNGTSVPRNAMNGWTFDPASNTISFNGTAVPQPGGQIEVRYGTICLP